MSKIKKILFVCTGNSARSIIAESIINNNFQNQFIAFSAGSNPSGKINPYIKEYLEEKKFNLATYYSKNFDELDLISSNFFKAFPELIISFANSIPLFKSSLIPDM